MKTERTGWKEVTTFMSHFQCYFSFSMQHDFFQIVYLLFIISSSNCLSCSLSSLSLFHFFHFSDAAWFIACWSTKSCADAIWLDIGCSEAAWLVGWLNDGWLEVGWFAAALIAAAWFDVGWLNVGWLEVGWLVAACTEAAWVVVGWLNAGWFCADCTVAVWSIFSCVDVGWFIVVCLTADCNEVRGTEFCTSVDSLGAASAERLASFRKSSIPPRNLSTLNWATGAFSSSSSEESSPRCITTGLCTGRFCNEENWVYFH